MRASTAIRIIRTQQARIEKLEKVRAAAEALKDAALGNNLRAIPGLVMDLDAALAEEESDAS